MTYFSSLSSISHSASASSKPTTRSYRDQPPRTSLSIIVAEDDPISRLFLVRVLQKLGHQVHSAANGHEALEILQGADKFDILFTDIKMPQLDGVEVAQILRRDNRFRHRQSLPIVAVTAFAMPGDRANYLRAGMDDYIPKPIDGKLLEIVLGHLTDIPQ